jgi:hypothetical protein
MMPQCSPVRKSLCLFIQRASFGIAKPVRVMLKSTAWGQVFSEQALPTHAETADCGRLFACQCLATSVLQMVIRECLLAQTQHLDKCPLGLIEQRLRAIIHTAPNKDVLTISRCIFGTHHIAFLFFSPLFWGSMLANQELRLGPQPAAKRTCDSAHSA